MWKKPLVLALVLMILFSSCMGILDKVAGQGGEYYIKVDLKSGVINGVSVSLDNPEISVKPGGKVSGYMEVVVENRRGGPWITPVVGVNSWDRDYFQCLASDAPDGKSTYRFEFDFLAPITQGTYYVAVFAGWWYSCEELVSNDHPPQFGDGDDVWDMSQNSWEAVISQGRSEGFYHEAGRAIRIIVSSSAHETMQENTIFYDDFESYEVGKFPSEGGWYLTYDGAGSEYQIITSDVAHSGSKSFQLIGQAWWSACADKYFASDAEVIGFEAFVMVNDFGSTPDTGDKTTVAVHFVNPSLDPWGRAYALIRFVSDGKVYAVTAEGWYYLQDFSLREWYKVRVTVNKTTDTFNVWINGQLKASNLKIEKGHATEITALRLASGHAGGIVYIDDVKVFEISSIPTNWKQVENILFFDDFESYDVGTFPSEGGWELVWNGRGDEYQCVTDEYWYSYTKSLQLWGQDWWSSVAQKKFSSDSKIIGFEAYILIESYSSKPSGSPVAARIMFWNREGGTWGKGYAGIDFTYDGNITTKDIWAPTFGTWQPKTWYKIRLVLNRSSNTFNVWINDKLVGENIDVLPESQDTYNINSLALFSDHAGVKVYFDDVKVFEVRQMLPELAELLSKLKQAKDVAIEFSRFNLQDGVDVCAEMLRTVAADVAGGLIGDKIKNALDIDLDKLPLDSQLALIGIDKVLEWYTEKMLEKFSVCKTATSEIIKEIANARKIGEMSDLNKIVQLYEQQYQKIEQIIQNTMYSWQESGPPENLEKISLQWFRLLDNYIESLNSAKSAASFYISPNRIGTIGQTAETKRWWNSPYKTLSYDWGLLLLKIAYSLLGYPTLGEIVTKIMGLTGDIAIILAYYAEVYSIVDENAIAYSDFYSIISYHIIPSLWNPQLYKIEPLTVSQKEFPDLSFLNPEAEARISCNYDWEVKANLRASIALFDVDGKLVYWNIGDKVEMDKGTTELKVSYSVSNAWILWYLIKHFKDPRLSVKAFVHIFSSDPSGNDYLYGPVEGEIKVKLVDILAISLGSPADLHVYDANNRHIGLNYETGQIEIEIPNAFYSGPHTEPQLVLIPEPSTHQDYRIEIVGRENGAYNLTSWLLINGTTTQPAQKITEISKGETHKLTISITENGQVIIRPSLEGIPLHYILAIIAAVSAISIILYVSKIRRKSTGRSS